MSQSIQLQVTQVGLEQSIAAAMKRVGSSSQINLGTSSKQINALSQPLGRITGQADEFSKSMAAANARVLAFGASAGIIAGVSAAMSGLLTSTIKVEKSLVEISTVINKTGSELDKFGQDIFNVAKNTGKSFDEVAKGALELARQGLNAEDTLARLNDALILSRLSGLDAAQSVEGLTAAFNSFKSSGITTAEILNKVVAAAQKYSVSEKDIIEGLKRSASVANLAGVSFEELAAVITAVQQKTARGGAVIGNAFKTIFSRIQDKGLLSDLQDMGVGITDLQGEVLPALKILENLAKKMEGISQIEKADIAEKVAGGYQLDKLLAALSDLSDKASVTTGALKAMGEAGDSAYKKNAILNETLAALLNKVTVSAEQLGAKLGEIGVTDSLKNVLGFFNSLLEGIQKILGEESGLGDLVRGLVKGLGSFLAGPGLALFGGIILKLSKDLVQFGFASLKAFFGIGKAAKEVQNVEGAISQILSKNVNLQQQLFALEGNRAGQLRLITGALVEQEAVLRRSANISSGLATPLYNVGGRAKSSGLRIGNSAGGYMPAVAQESKSIQKGVGGARSGDRPVVMPNFNFGGGKKGTMVAHTGEYVVPNFNGSGGSAVFNRRMVQSMGLPSGAKKIGAAGGFVPNFVDEADRQRDVKGLGASTILQSIGFQGDESYDEIFKKIQRTYEGYKVQWVNDKKNAFTILSQNGESLTSQQIPVAAVEKQRDSKELKKGESIYDARQQPNSAVMLIPQNSPYNSTGLNVAFTEKRKVGGKIYDKFIGGVAGIQENLSDTDKINFSKVSKIDESLREGLSEAAFNILSGIQPGIKLDAPNDFLPKNIEGLLEKGGPGAFGALKGALFEGIINKVAEAKGRNFKDSGSLDIDFKAGGDKSRTILETIFGLEARQYDFADFKNSKKSKASYIDQVINYLPKDKSVDEAAGGYIPNFVGKSREVGRGVQGAFYKLGSKGGMDVGVKKFLKKGSSQDIENEWLSTQFINKKTDVKGLSAAKNLSTLEDSLRKNSIRKEFISDPIAKKVVGPDAAELYGLLTLDSALNMYGMRIPDLHGGNYTVDSVAAENIKQLKTYPTSPVGVRDAIKGRIRIIDTGFAKPTVAGGEYGQWLSNAKKTISNNKAQTNAAGGYIPNFANPLTDAFGGLKFAASAANTFRKTLPKGSVKKAIKEKNFEPIFGPLLKFFQNPSALIKSNKDLENAKKAIKLTLNSDLIREAFAKRIAPLISSQNYDTSEVFLKAAGGISEFEKNVEGYAKYKLFGGTKNLSQYAPEGIKGLVEKGKYLKFTDPGYRHKIAEAPIGGLEFKHVTRRTDEKGGYYSENYLLGGYTGRVKEISGKKYASYKDRWDVDLQKSEKEFLRERLNKSSLENNEYFTKFISDPEDPYFEPAELNKELGANTYGAADLNSFILRELVSAIPKAKPAVFKGVVPMRSASGYIPSFADPLREAIGREMAAGVPTSQIYIDKNSSLKNAANPMGLMVANRRDEPSGGFQGISRARREGANPMTYGAAGGFVPNYNNPYGARTMYTQSAAPSLPPLSMNAQQTAFSSGAAQPMAALAASAEKAAKGNRDMLGTIFAVQGAMSALAGATEGSTNKITIASNAIAEGVGSFATASFAIQGLTEIAGNTGGAFGKVVGKLGPYGLAIAGITAAYSATAKYLDEVNGINKAAAQNIAMMSDAASKAAFNLNNLPQAAQKNIQQSAVGLVSGAAAYGREYKSFKGESLMIRSKDVDFQGSDLFSKGELQKSLDSVSESALGAGVSYDFMWNEINKRSEDGKMTIKEVDELTREFTKLMVTSYELGDAMRNLDLSPKSTLMKDLAGMSPEDFDKALSDLKPGTPINDKTSIGKIQRSIVDALPAEKQAAFDPNSEAAKNQVREIRRQALDQEKALKDSAAESDRSFKINLGKVQAQLALENKLAFVKKAAAIYEVNKLEEVNRIQNNNLITDDEKVKRIAEINNGYDLSIQALQTQEQKIKNIEQALIDSVSGGLGIDESEIASTVSKIQGNLPEFDAGNINGYITSVEKALTASDVALNNQRAIVQALIEAEVVNNGLNEQQKEQLELSLSRLGIELKTLDTARDRAIEEAKINSMMESAKSLDNFNFEKQSLDIAYDILSVNQEIEKVKRDSSLNELEKAKEIFKLEEKRAGLEEGKITFDYDKAATDAARAFQDRVLSVAKDQFKIEPRMISGSLSGGPEAVIDAAREKIPLKYQESFDELIADQRADYERNLTLAERKRELDKSGVGPVLESDVQKRAREGFSGGMEEGVNKLQDSINTFGFDIAEKIPQMFSDNMSSAINKMIEGGESFGDVLQGAAYEFVKGINQANIQNLSNKFSNFLFKSDGGAASGIGSMLGFASGGKVSGGSGSKDDVPAMLMGGEYVVNKKAVSKYGPKFLEAINNGTLNGYAKGGKVQRGPQGNFYAPGTFGQGAISGKRNLLDFATQTGTSGKFDQMINESGYQSIALEPESSRLSVSGMRNSPMFDATQSAKQQAFDLYLQQYNAEREAKKQAKEQKKALTTQLLMLVGGAALGGIGKAASAGVKASITAAEAAKGGALTFGETISAGFSGAFKGGMIDNQSVGGLNKLFSGIGSMATGNFKGGFNQMKLSQIGTSEQLSKAITGYGNRGFAEYLGVAPRASIISGPNSAMAASSMPIGMAKTGAGVVQYSNIGQINLPTSDLANTSTYLQYKQDAVEILKRNGFSESETATFLYGLSTNDIYTMVDKARRESGVMQKAYELSPKPTTTRAIGGMIPSTSGIDTVPAMLSGGEFVMNRSAVQSIGAPNLQSMNSGGTSITSEETSKELNEKLLAKLDELINSSGSAGNITINVAPSGQTSQETSQDPSASRQQLARQIKDAVLQIINDEKRIGGSLRR